MIEGVHSLFISQCWRVNDLKGLKHLKSLVINSLCMNLRDMSFLDLAIHLFENIPIGRCVRQLGEDFLYKLIEELYDITIIPMYRSQANHMYPLRKRKR
mmetsp:Transcript_28609/g.39878  ORF Transcript_28609/g.39878 Transcript_28609/m.39878 type:complete len:99 (+) Transcript_28609:554-850(+)